MPESTRKRWKVSPTPNHHPIPTAYLPRPLRPTLTIILAITLTHPNPNPNKVDKIYTLVGDILIAVNPFKWARWF